MGGISLLLTIINIICIYVFGMLTFWIKEVAPLKAKSALWEKVVPGARAFNKAQNRGDMNLLELRSKLTPAQRLPKKQRRRLMNQHRGRAGYRNQQVPYAAQRARGLKSEDSFPSLAALFFEEGDDEDDEGEDDEDDYRDANEWNFLI
jgi:hypothetical protein